VNCRGPGHKGVMDLKGVREGGWLVESRIDSVLWAFNRSFHLVKCLSKVVAM
jgi:hypothetical protein